jgi:hypothetical protein
VLLAVSVEMYSLSEPLRTDSDLNHKLGGHPEVAIVGEGRDLISSWASSSLGKPLFSRLLSQLLGATSKSGKPTGSVAVFGLDELGVQALATVVCIVGGARQILVMLTDEVRQSTIASF